MTASTRRAPDVADVAETIERTGPIQSQTARSSFLGIAARLPGVTKAVVTEAFESGAIVRGSNIRGTVHTSTPVQHALLDRATREGMRRLWVGTLRPDRVEVEQIWAAIEEYALEQWRSPAELNDYLAGWLRDQGDADCARRLGELTGRYFAVGHSGLVRRPAKGDWSGQGAPLYRTAPWIVDPPPSASSSQGPTATGTATVAGEPAHTGLVRLHLTCHGPASRHDIAWWSGLGLRAIDAALGHLAAAGETISAPGPDGRDYVDLASAPRSTRTRRRGIWLLPEFDATMCAYDPHARERFVTRERARILFNSKNGLLSPPVLVDGVIGGYWHCVGSSRRRPMAIRWFEGTRPVGADEVAAPIRFVESALDIEVTDVDVAAHDPLG